jgi:hypothetical protein
LADIPATMPAAADILNDPDIAQAYEDVRSDKSDTTWLILKVCGKLVTSIYYCISLAVFSEGAATTELPGKPIFSFPMPCGARHETLSPNLVCFL